jgi:hypothetical protein
MQTDYVPARDADFNVFFKNLVRYVGGKTGGSTPEWTHIPTAAISELVDQPNMGINSHEAQGAEVVGSEW